LWHRRPPDVSDVHTVARRDRPVDLHIHKTPAGQPVGECRTDPRHGLGNAFDLLRDLVDLPEGMADWA
jgi:hypothetical protein